MNDGKLGVDLINQVRDPESLSNFGGLSYKSDEQDKTHLQTCLTGCMMEGFYWRDIGNLIKDLCGESIKASHLGGELVLFQAVGKHHIMIEELDCFRDWFDTIRPWSEGDINLRRIIWTKWYGVPLHGWNPRFFGLVAAKFGKIISIDANVKSKQSLVCARILIRTS